MRIPQITSGFRSAGATGTRRSSFAAIEEGVTRFSDDVESRNASHHAVFLADTSSEAPRLIELRPSRSVGVNVQSSAIDDSGLIGVASPIDKNDWHGATKASANQVAARPIAPGELLRDSDRMLGFHSSFGLRLSR